MFKKSLVAIAVLGATAFSAQAFTLPYDNTTNNTADAAAGWMVNHNFAAVRNELNAQISQNTNDIHGLQQDMVENEWHDHAQDQNIGVNKNNIEKNKQEIAANKTQIEKNKQEIAANKTQISQNTNDIHGLQQDMVENEWHDHAQDQNIGVNKNNIEKNAEAIKNNYAEMKQNFAAMNTRIDDLDDEMKKGFASQAALAGLFQPYNVGKFNLSVALGGYESEQAMALGTGYRFNENFAMKAGIATDVGGFDHLTYNIGANFEW